MKRISKSIAVGLCWMLCSLSVSFASTGEAPAKPSPDKVIKWLTEGNTRFTQGKSTHPHADAQRISMADTENQGNHALATILSCSDSRVPPELVFDTGLMDLFVIRVAGNVGNTDETGTVEYGLCHVNTPVLVVLGHTQCGAVTAVTQEVTGHGHPLERNIPPLVAPIIPAVMRTLAEHPELKDNALITAAIETNVWQVIKDIFLKSPATRELMSKGKVAVVGAMYDMHTGGVNWLPAEKVKAILQEVEASPDKAQGAMYEKSPPAAPVASRADTKATPASEEPSLAPKVKELAAKMDAKTADAAADIKDVKARLDALAAQIKGLPEGGKAVVDGGAEAVKALSADVKGLKSAVDMRMAAAEASSGWMLWLLVGFIVFCAGSFCWLFMKLGSLGTQHEQLREKVRKAFERVNSDIKHLGG